MLNKTSILTANPWVVCFKPNPRAALRLFCFPYAAGAPTIYRGWPDKLWPKVEVCAIQLPGRGSRLSERPFTDLTSLVQSLAEAIRPFLDKPFAFFGHSLGALVSFELASMLKQADELEPLHLFVSGRCAPHLLEDEPVTYNLPDAELIEALRLLKGTPDALLAHPELMELMLPMIRADFQICQTYTYSPRSPLGCPITVYGGLHDPLATREDLEAWQEYTSGAFSLRMVSGEHFFLHSHETLLVQMLARELHGHITKP
jgi:medium-chain acyl-[acyl-carrier-protein] hydrolase